jgi:DNA-directed RNA polymerase beta subunit
MDDLFGNVPDAGPEDNFGDFDDYEEEITQEDAWVIINKFFDTKGLVRQQLDSFDEFIQNSIQELVDDSGEIKVIPEDQFIPGQEIEKVLLSELALLRLDFANPVYVCCEIFSSLRRCSECIRSRWGN